MQPTKDRRKRVRVSLQWPLRLSRRGDVAVETRTENLSSGGFYCVTDRPFAQGERLECLLGLPSLDLGYYSPPVSLRCDATVVRVETLGPQSFGLGCRMERPSLVFRQVTEQ